MRPCHAISLFATLVADIGFPVCAAPLEYVPVLEVSAKVAGVVPEADGDEVGLGGEYLAERTLSEQSYEALLVSETRTRRLASDDTRAAVVSGTSGAPRERIVSRQDVARSDPLALALTRMFDPSAKEMLIEARSAAVNVEYGSTQTYVSGLMPDLEPSEAEMVGLRENLATAIEFLVSPLSITEREVRYTFAGFTGIWPVLGASSSALFGPYSATSSVGTSPAAGAPAQHGGEPSPDSNAARQLLNRIMLLVWQVSTHPLSIGLLLVLVVFRLLEDLYRRGPAYRGATR